MYVSCFDRPNDHKLFCSFLLVNRIFSLGLFQLSASQKNNKKVIFAFSLLSLKILTFKNIYLKTVQNFTFINFTFVNGCILTVQGKQGGAMAGSCEGVSSSTEEASPSPFSQEGCHTGKRKAKICLKISQRYQPADYLPGKPSLLGRVSELCLKNTLIWSNPAKKVLIAQKKRNKKGVSF